MPRKPDTTDNLAALERALEFSKNGRYVLRLYVTGATPRSTLAVATIKRLCELHLAGRYDLEVIDLYQQPARAKLDQIIAVPTLVKEAPLPVRKLIGDLSDPDRVLIALNLIPEKK